MAAQEVNHVAERALYEALAALVRELTELVKDTRTSLKQALEQGGVRPRR